VHTSTRPVFYLKIVYNSITLKSSKGTEYIIGFSKGKYLMFNDFTKVLGKNNKNTIVNLNVAKNVKQINK